MANASSIAIQDGSFDVRSLAATAWNNTITPWQETGGTGNGNGFVERIAGFSSDGLNHLGMNLNHTVWQDPGHIYQPNTLYTLTVAVGNRSGNTQAGNLSQFLLGSADGSVFATGSLNASGVPLGTFRDATSLTVNTHLTPAAVGRPLRIQLQARGAGRSHFDNIRLTAVQAAQPQTISFGPLSPISAGAPPSTFSLNASASSGLAVTFVSSNPAIASVSGATLTPHAAGTVTISARQAGNASFLAAPEVSQSLEIYSAEREGQTITFTRPADPVHGAAGIPLTATASSGLPVTFSSSDPAIATIIDGALVGLRPGTASISATQAGNADFLPAPAAFWQITVAPGSLTLPSAITRQASLGSAPFSAEVPVAATLGGDLPWTAEIMPHVPWLRLLGAGGGTPGTINLEFIPAKAVPNAQATAIRIVQGASVFLLPVQFTGEITSAYEFFEFADAADVPITTASPVPAGKQAFFVLGYAPEPGSTLTAIRNSGTNFINGAFSNLAHGSHIELFFDGVGYPFVANYYGGDGNDLVLQWAGTRLVGWGSNAHGQTGAVAAGLWTTIPTEVQNAGALAGKTILSIASGGNHSLALCSDGTIAAWGRNWRGALGDGTTINSEIPVAVDRTGVLAGKTVVAIAAGNAHSLALCSDGTVAAWGDNGSSQLGQTTEVNWDNPLPLLVHRGGVLSGKTVVSISAGHQHNLALCSDGTLVAWGANDRGQLGRGNTLHVNGPVAVTLTGTLSGRKVLSLHAGNLFSLVLCADGHLAAWGYGGSGSLGTGNTSDASTPVAVVRSGVLAGKTITQIATGSHTLALCSDGSLAAWGHNQFGPLGDLTTVNSSLPVRVDQNGVLAGQKIASIHAGSGTSFAVLADGRVSSWGSNEFGGLGDGTVTSRSSPGWMDLRELGGTERIAMMGKGSISSHQLALISSPPAAGVITREASAITDIGATLNGTVNPSGSETRVWFEFGTSEAYGAVIPADPERLQGDSASDVSAALTGLLSSTTYHFRAVANSIGGTVHGLNQTFTTSSLASLADLQTDGITLFPGFSPQITTYHLIAPPDLSSLIVAPTATESSATLTINGTPAPNAPLPPRAVIPLNDGENTIEIKVTAPSGSFSQSYFLIVNRLPQTFTIESAEPKLHSPGIEITSQAINLELGHLPATGVDLTLLENTGSSPIHGTFSNLNQGQKLTLSFGGITADYVANYFGGTGNDLVLHWANQRLIWWGNILTTDSSTPIPVAINTTGILAGKTVTGLASSSRHALAVCSDGTVAAWGSDDNGRLGHGYSGSAKTPIAVNTSGALANRKVVAVAVGEQHSLALCADGTVAAWGSNDNGQLGSNIHGAGVPAMVDVSGVLRDKFVVAIAAGEYHSLALCSDGILVAWGWNSQSQLGNTTAGGWQPTEVDRGGALKDKLVTAIAVGANHNLALCADGTLVGWGHGGSYALGNNSNSRVFAPILLNHFGALAGKRISAISAGGTRSFALCDDGSMAEWGAYFPNPLTGSRIPVPVEIEPANSGVGFVEIAMGNGHTILRGNDGSLVAWGNNLRGQLGDGTTIERKTPVPSNAVTDSLRPGERISRIGASRLQTSMAVVGMPPRPLATTLAATDISDTAATLRGEVSPNNNENIAVFFEYGLNTNYTTRIEAEPALANGTAPVAASLPLSGLLPGTRYFYRIVTTSLNGTIGGENLEFTTGNSSALANLTLGAGTLSPAFAGLITNYEAMVLNATASIAVSATASHPTATVAINGAAAETGTASRSVPLAVGRNEIPVQVTSSDGSSSMTYTVAVIRLPSTYLFDAPGRVPASAASVSLADASAAIELGHTPEIGASLMMVENTGPGLIQGEFSNLAHGQLVTLTYQGGTYAFVADYFGGTGNDLVLQWANRRLLAWGENNFGQLGDNSTETRTSAVPVLTSGALAGKTILKTATGGVRNLVLCSDGSLVQWGRDTAGEMGTFNSRASSVPLAVDQTGVLAGKQVIAISAGDNHFLVLCSDGTLAAWGEGRTGQLGNASARFPGESRPMLVNQTGVLAGKTVVAISAGFSHNLVLCSDGTLAAWGANNAGQLGDDTIVQRNAPVLVSQTGELAGKTVVAIAAGGFHSMALCSDGTLASWGSNSEGQLGRTGTITRVPRFVSQTGLLSGKTVTTIAAGEYHNLALCSDGTLAAWGFNSNGRLGNNSSTSSAAPVAVLRSGVLAGREIHAIAAGGSHSAALASDGSLASWGLNTRGQLGIGTLTNSLVPAAVAPSAAFVAGERFYEIGLGATHSMALTALPPLPSGSTLAATAVRDGSATLNGTVNAEGTSVAVHFEYGPTEAYGQRAVISSAPTGTPTTAVSANLGSLSPGTTYHYRIVVSGPGGIIHGENKTFTTSGFSTLSALTLNAGTLSPTFSPASLNYLVTVPHSASSLTLIPTAGSPGTVIRINGAVVASGAGSSVALETGANAITVATLAADGINALNYNLNVTRLPEDFAFAAAGDVPLTVPGFLASGNSAAFALNFPPITGTGITVIRNTGQAPIQGRFSNLAHGQAVALQHAGITYVFTADYYGGDGNDLVLRWAHTRAFTWGTNVSGELGVESLEYSFVPVPVDHSGVLANKSIQEVASGTEFAMALAADGTVASWGSNRLGRLGIGSQQSVGVPSAVDRSGVLAGRQVVAISAGAEFAVALCDDGSMAAWGNGTVGQLGNGAGISSSTPVAVVADGVLSGKRVTAISTGAFHTLALCADGTVAAWGGNTNGQLGNNTKTRSDSPVPVDRSGALAGKEVVAVSAGVWHSLALSADGLVFAWGTNSEGQLGNNSTTSSLVPVAVHTGGLLAGKKVIAISAGAYHSLVLCDDGTLLAWGDNSGGTLGNGSGTASLVPVAVDRSGVLAGKSIVAIAAYEFSNYALTSDGSIVSWGRNDSGQLGIDSDFESAFPVLVDTANLAPGERFIRLGRGPSAVVASPARDLVPFIADNSTIVGISHLLAWNPEPLAEDYRVFFGTSNEAVAAATETSPEFLGTSATAAWTGDMPPLAGDAVYYWRVDTRFATGRQVGKVWSFRIAPIEMVTQISHTVITGMDAATLEFPIDSIMTGERTWSVTPVGTLPPWLSLVTASGTTPEPLRLRFDSAAMATGFQTTTLRVVSGAASFDVPVDFRVVPLDLIRMVAHPTRPAIYAINRGNSGESFGRLVEIDPATGEMLRSLPIGINPTSATIDPINERLYVVNFQHAETNVVDLANWRQLPPLLLGNQVGNLAATGDGKLIAEDYNQWVDMSLLHADSGELIQRIGGIRAGGGKADWRGKFYFHSDSNSSAARITKYAYSDQGFEQLKTSEVLAYGGGNLVLSGDASRLFWQGRAFAADNLAATARLPGEVHATNHAGDLAIGPAAIWWGDTGTLATTLPFSSPIAAVSADDAHLVRYNPITNVLVSTPLATLNDVAEIWPRHDSNLSESPQRLTWPAVPGATGYRVFIAADATALAAMTQPVATVSETFHELPSPLPASSFYTWRVDAVTAGGSLAGSPLTFGIRFASGLQLTKMENNTTATRVAMSDRFLLIGGDSLAQLYDFDSQSGASSPLRLFSGYFSPGQAVPVAMGRDQAMIGAASFGIPPVNNTGAAYLLRAVEGGFWQSTPPLTLPNPLAGEGFGNSIAASGNVMLAGVSSTSTSRIGRVAAYITEPTVEQVQVITAADAVAGDGFGSAIAIEGNQAIIASPGRGSSLNRLACLYAFSRSTTTGQWTQTQKIPIPGATSAGGAARSLALAGSTMATVNEAGLVTVFTKGADGQWAPSASINRTAVPGSSPQFAFGLALEGDLLLIGDPTATHALTTGGAIFPFRRTGSTWNLLPTITPPISPLGGNHYAFGAALAARDGWLLASSGGSAPAWIFRVAPEANRLPRFLPGIPSQAVVGRKLATTVQAEDPDGNDGLVMELLQGPAWLRLADEGNGRAVLSGTPLGSPGDVSEVQLSVRDSAGATTLYTLRLSLLDAANLPVLTKVPEPVEISAGRELNLQAEVSGIGPFQWQWYFNDEPIGGATRPSWMIHDISLADAGRYRVRVSNSVGEAVSAEIPVTVIPATLAAGDWPTFGGSAAHTGRHAAAVASHRFLPAWEHPVDQHPLNRAAISGGRAFVIPASSSAGTNLVRAIDLATGDPAWSFPFPSSFSSNPPTVHDGKLYFQRVTNSLNQLYSIDAQTGGQHWVADFGAQWHAYEAPTVTELGIFINGGTFGGMYGYNHDGSVRFFLTNLPQDSGWTPTANHGRLFSHVGGNFIEHNPQSGATLWYLATGGGTGVVAIQGNSALVRGDSLLCVDVHSRSLRWRITEAFSGDPAIHSDRVFAIRDREVRSYALADGSAGPVYQTTAAAGEALQGQPILFNDRLVISSGTRTWIFDLESAKLLQTLEAGGLLSYANGYLLAAGADGVVRAFLATPHGRIEVRGPDGVPLLGETPQHSIGAPPVGGSSSITIGIGNTGFEDLTLSSWILAGPHAADFRITKAPADSLAPGAATTLEIHFEPSAKNPRTATLILASNDPNQPQLSVQLLANPPDVEVLAANAITGVSATLNGRVASNDNDVALSFEYGTTTGYGTSVQAEPGVLSAGAASEVAADLTALRPGTDYYFRMGAATADGTHWSDGSMFTTLSDNALLRSLFAAGPPLPHPAFDGETSGYIATVPFGSASITLAPVTDHPRASVRINGEEVPSGSQGPAMPLIVGNTALTTVVSAEDGVTRKTYSLVVTRLPQEFLLNAGTAAPVRANGFSAAGLPIHPRLGFAPETGSSLTLVENTGMERIQGSFSNLVHGQRITLTYQGVDYDFVANYYGGTGNDLVLHWANNRIAAWGLNSYGQLGNGDTVRSLAPIAVDDHGALANKTVLAVSGGYLHSLALCSDGSLATWGYNAHGQLGNNGHAASNLPVAVEASGALAGKTVIAISAGPYHNLALCSDGTLASWGYNNYGQLGTGDTLTSRVPVRVDPIAALAGKQVVAIQAGSYHSVALCSDGTVAAWGYNDEGELGDGTTRSSTIPVAVDHSDALGGKQVSMIRTGQYHTLALCTDGTLVSWGYNQRGQLGDGSTANRNAPVDITGFGALAGRSVAAIATGGSHSLALSTDGTLSAWGHNHRRQLGVTDTLQRSLPTVVAMTSPPLTITAGAAHNLALTAAGNITGWGDNSNGQTGHGDAETTASANATSVDMSLLAAGSRVVSIASGAASSHSLAIYALPAGKTPTDRGTIADPASDGIPALVKYAFGLAPDETDHALLPQPAAEAGHLVARFSRPIGVQGVTYGAEWSGSLLPGTWIDIPNTGTIENPEFRITTEGKAMLFMRIKVTAE